MKDKALRLLKISLIFLTVNSYSELGTVVCSQLPIDEEHKQVCPMVIGALEITESAKSTCSCQLFNDLEKVACLGVVGELEIPVSITSACFHPDYKDNRIKCLKNGVNSGVPGDLLDRDSRGAIESTFCSVENIFENPLRIGRSQTVESFKVIKMKGQKIYSLSTLHLNPHISNPVYEILHLLLDGEQQAEAYEELKAILDSRSDTVISEKTDVLHIVELLRTDNSDLKWIGVEQSEEEFKKNPIQRRICEYRQFKSFLLSKKLTPQEVEDTLYLISEAYIIAVAEHPELFKEVEFIPLEDNVYARESQNLIIEVGRISEELYLSILSIGNEVAKGIENADRAQTIVGEAIVSVTKIPQQLISDELSQWTNEESRSLVRDVFRKINQFVEYMSKRDQAMASTVLQQSGNGLILTGSSHSEGITQSLLSVCRDLQ